MDNRLQATFMPRQTAASGEAYARPKGPPNFLMIIGVTAFVLVGGIYGGLYFYKDLLTKSNAAKQDQIEEAIKNFDPQLTDQLTILKARMDAGKTLLANHSALSLFFTLLELNTAQTVRFKELTYKVENDNTISLTLRGEARSYNAIAYQSDVFSKLSQLKTPVFSDLSLGDTGVISFNVSAKIDPASVAYKNLFPSAPPAQAPSSSPASTPASNPTATSTSVTAPTSTSTPTQTPGTSASSTTTSTST